MRAISQHGAGLYGRTVQGVLLHESIRSGLSCDRQVPTCALHSEGLPRLVFSLVTFTLSDILERRNQCKLLDLRRSVVNAVGTLPKLLHAWNLRLSQRASR